MYPAPKLTIPSHGPNIRDHQVHPVHHAARDTGHSTNQQILVSTATCQQHCPSELHNGLVTNSSVQHHRILTAKHPYGSCNYTPQQYDGRHLAVLLSNISRPVHRHHTDHPPPVRSKPLVGLLITVGASHCVTSSRSSHVHATSTQTHMSATGRKVCAASTYVRQ